ncbi:MAG: peptidyl-prolyl cis-trans isomerase [Acidobacteriota bacterium]|nr:peptidyl-prolyl cis-trans isomerase [Acidobacteriota bacterium]
MIRNIASLVLTAGSLFAQAEVPAPTPAPDTVLAIIDGKKLTYGELEAYLTALGPQRKAAALANRRELLNQYAFQARLVELAEKDKLDQQSPYKEALEVSRRALLTEAEIDHKATQTQVTAEDQKNFYESHKDRYTEVKLQVLFLGFTSNAVAKENPKKYRNEAQTKALALKLRAEAKTGADFVRLVKQYSEDDSSKAKNGEYGTVKLSDNLPADIKKAVFALKQGEVSEPIPQQNGYYLFRAESLGVRPYEQVKDDIYTELRDSRVRQWMEETQKGIAIKIEDEAFFAPKQ